MTQLPWQETRGSESHVSAAKGEGGRGRKGGGGGEAALTKSGLFGLFASVPLTSAVACVGQGSARCAECKSVLG